MLEDDESIFLHPPSPSTIPLGGEGAGEERRGPQTFCEWRWNKNPPSSSFQLFILRRRKRIMVGWEHQPLKLGGKGEGEWSMQHGEKGLVGREEGRKGGLREEEGNLSLREILLGPHPLPLSEALIMYPCHKCLCVCERAREKERGL